MKDFADDNFKFDENGRKLSKPVKNTVEKGEIALTSNFSFSHSVFKRLFSPGASKSVTVGMGQNCQYYPGGGYQEHICVPILPLISTVQIYV